ncbi:hypothetical protein G6F65_022544 [Rhizopus arrhizus]|nr:hypothetical protein G6F65_022544 [Rhizopus arrhizus]
MTPTLRRKLEALAERREELERLLAEPDVVADNTRPRQGRPGRRRRHARRPRPARAGRRGNRRRADAPAATGTGAGAAAGTARPAR